MSVPEWATSLPPDLQATDVVRNTPDLATAVKRLVDLDRYKGASLALPKDGDEASQAAFREAVNKRGFIAGEVPADPNGYDTAGVDLGSVGLGDEWKAAKLKEFHELGLTKAQARKALAREVDGLAGALKSFAEKHGDGGMDAVRRASAKYNLDGNPAGILHLLHEIGATMSEDGTKPAPGGGTGGMSLQDIDVQIVDTDEAMLKLPPYDPRGKALLDKKYALLRQRAALESGDKSLLGVSFENVAKGIGRR